MKSQRKVKTVRCNCNYPELKYGEFYYVQPSDSIHLYGDVYSVKIRKGESIVTVDVELTATPFESANFIVEEFHEEEPLEPSNNAYATIADVERMIREAMGESEKVRKSESDAEIMFELVDRILKWDDADRLFRISRNMQQPISKEVLIDTLLLEYTITKKKP